MPDTSDMRIDPATNNLIREGVPSVVNPTDLNAAEEALKIKDAHGGKISVLTMGPPQAEQALRDILSMGADRGVLISDRSFAGADTLATSYALWTGIQRIVAEDGPFDLILFGKQAIDGETGQVPPGVAVRLGVPIITYVNKIEKFDPAKRVMHAQRKVDDGIELVESALPAALTVSEECNRPRQPTIDGVLNAKRAKIAVWNRDAVKADPRKIGLTGSPTFVRKVFVPPPKKSGEIKAASSGNVEETVKWLVDQLLKKGVLGEKKTVPEPPDVQPQTVLAAAQKS
ncbi:MAG: electron transfer flavoprotein subunit beta/FixA family protein, partial [Candidatus Bathyarchaeia archaeon]